MSSVRERAFSRCFCCRCWIVDVSCIHDNICVPQQFYCADAAKSSMGLSYRNSIRTLNHRRSISSHRIRNWKIGDEGAHSEHTINTRQHTNLYAQAKQYNANTHTHIRRTVKRDSMAFGTTEKIRKRERGREMEKNERKRNDKPNKL